MRTHRFVVELNDEGKYTPVQVREIVIDAIKEKLYHSGHSAFLELISVVRESLVKR